jgi:hypothetical protein
MGFYASARPAGGYVKKMASSEKKLMQGVDFNLGEVIL